MRVDTGRARPDRSQDPTTGNQVQPSDQTAIRLMQPLHAAPPNADPASSGQLPNRPACSDRKGCTVLAGELWGYRSGSGVFPGPVLPRLFVTALAAVGLCPVASR